MVAAMSFVRAGSPQHLSERYTPSWLRSAVWGFQFGQSSALFPRNLGWSLLVAGGYLPMVGIPSDRGSPQASIGEGPILFAAFLCLFRPQG